MKRYDKDGQFEELFKKGASLAAEEMGKDAREYNADFSEEHKNKMKRLFDSEKRKQNIKKISVYVTRIAAVLVIVVAFSGLAIFRVDALKDRFMNMFTNTEETNTKVEFNSGSSYTIGDITIGYIPEGFELIKEKTTANVFFLKFSMDDEYFDISIRRAHDSLSLDTEDSNIDSFNLNGRDVLYTQKENTHTLTGYIGENTLFLVGNVDRNTLYQIYQYIELN